MRMKFDEWKQCEIQDFKLKNCFEMYEQLELQLDFEEMENMDCDEVELVIRMIRMCHSEIFTAWKKSFARERRMKSDAVKWEKLMEAGGKTAQRSSYWLERNKQSQQALLNERGKLRPKLEIVERWIDIANLFDVK